MADDQIVAPETEATEEVVQTEVKQAEAAEAPESTEGQVKDQPAEDDGEPESEEVSESKKRRERRKAENQRLRDEARAAEEKLKAYEERVQKARDAAQSNTLPKESDFSDYSEFLVALGAYHAARNMDSRAEREAQEAAEAQRAEVERLRRQTEQEIAQNWATQAEDARRRYADFDQVVSAPDLPVSKHMAALMANADNGADIAYYLGTHRADAHRIAQLSPIEQAMEIGAISARVSLPKPKSTPSAPDPVTPVKPRGTAQKSAENMSFEEYRAARMAGKL